MVVGAGGGWVVVGGGSVVSAKTGSDPEISGITGIMISGRAGNSGSTGAGGGMMGRAGGPYSSTGN